MARRITLNIVTTSDPKGVRQTRRALSDLAKRIRALNKEFSNLNNVTNAIKDVQTGINRLTGDMEQLTRAQKELRVELKRGSSDAKKAADSYSAASKAQQKFTQTGAAAEKQQRRTKKATQDTAEEVEELHKALGDASRQAGRADANFENFEKTMRDVARATGLSEHAMESFQTTMRDASKLTGSMDKQRRAMKELHGDLKRGEEEITQAIQKRRMAQEKLDALMSSPTRNKRQIEDARRELEASARAALTAEKNYGKLENRLESMKRDLMQYADVQERLSKFKADPAFEKMFADPRIARRLETIKDSMESFEKVGKRLGTTMRQSLDRIKAGSKNLSTMNSDVDDLVASLIRLTKVGNDLGKLSMDRFAKAIGNPTAAVNQATKAIREQNTESLRLSSTVGKMDNGLAQWEAAERELARALLQGNAALNMRRQVTASFGSAQRAMSGLNTNLEAQRIRLLQQQNRLTEESISLQNRLRAAEQRREGTDRSNVAEYQRATDAINEMRQAIIKNNQAIEANENNLQQNAQQANRATQQFKELQQATNRMNAQFTNLRSTAGSDIFSAITGGIRRFIGDINKLAAALTGKLISGIQRASAALRQFVGMSGGAMFAGLQRSLQGIGNGFTRFADTVVNSMQRARHSMMEFYAAGYSMMMIGSQMQQFGLQINREMGRQLENFMEYEQARNQAAVAGAEAIYKDGTRGPEGNWQAGVESYSINTEIVDRMVRGMQYGTYTPDYLNPSGKPVPVAFDAKELAQGLYYYSSAIGVPITDINEREVAGVMTTIMQAAKVTNTGIETATKGTMNVAMEFGYDPRNLSPENAKAISSITARMAYLANISTMEMSDIAETFKMVGPQAHFLSPGALEGQAGAGLDETFLLAFLASEVGLRGGNVGRGINQAFTSLLDPTEKMLEVSGKHFGDGEKWTEDQFNEFFKEDGALKGGITGFLETLTKIPRKAQATMLAEMFTSNATRALMGPVLASHDFDIDRFLTEMEENPFLWLEAAIAQTANSVNGWFQFMKNGWFQFMRSIIDSIDGTLMGAFEGIGTVLFELANTLTDFPEIGQAIAGFVTAIGAIATIGGTVLMAAGGILVLGRSFALLGGFIAPAIRMLAFAGVTLLGLIPLFIAIGAAIAIARAAWTTDFLGMRSAFEDFREGTNLREFINEQVQGLAQGMMRLGRIFDQFATGIIFGKGPINAMNDLFMAMRSVFGPKLGDVAIQGLLKLREHMKGVRADIEDFVSGVGESGVRLQTFGLAIQGFLEQIFMGSQRAETSVAQDQIGRLLGIEGLSDHLKTAADAVSNFVGRAIVMGKVLVTVWATLMGDIYENIVRIFSGTGISGIFDGLGTLVQGVFEGIAAAITGMLGTVEYITRRIADFAEGLREAGDAGVELLGFTITFDGAMRALGATIGLVLGARLVLMFSPLAMMFARLIPMAMTFTSVLVGMAGRMIVLAAQVAIATAAWAAQAAVMAGGIAVRAALAAANALLSASQAGAAAGGGVLTSVLVAVTGGALSAASATTLLNIAMTPLGMAIGAVVIALGGLFVLLAGIAGGFTLLAGAGIALVTITQGIGAGFAALGQFLAGVWTGIQPVIVAFGALIGVAMDVMAIIGELVGTGNAFHTMGLMVGASVAGLIGLFSLLAGAILLVLSPLLIVGAAFAGLGVAFAMALADAGTFTGALYLMFETMVTGIADLLNFLVNDVIIGSLEGALNSLLDAAEGGGVLTGPFRVIKDLYGDEEGNVGLPEADFYDGLTSKIQGMRPAFEATGMIHGDAYSDGFLSSLSETPIGEEINSWLEPMGMSLENIDAKGLTDVVNEMVKMPDAMNELQGIDWSFLGPQGDEFEKALSDYERWEKLVDTAGLAEATRMYEMAGWEIPEAPNMQDYMGAAEDMQEAAYDMEQATADWNAALAQLTEMSLGDIFSALYDPLAGQGGKSLIGMMTEVGDQIITNAQSEGGGSWLNMDELLADVAGSGVQIDENMAGRNIHKALEPALKIISEQTGVSMETLMKDIPKFYAPEKFLNLATADMVKGISGFTAQYGSELYKSLDTLGTDIFDQAGVPFEEAGLDWVELNQFAIGKAIAGQDWNLAGYLSESWGISIDEANAYLQSKGIDAEAVTQDWYQNVEDAVLSQAGAFSVLTEEQYNWLGEATNGFKDKFIELSTQDFAEMSDTMKLILTNMGYTFVVTDIVPPEAIAKAEAQIKAFTDTVNGLKVMEGGVDGVMSGIAEEWKQAGVLMGEAGVLIDEATGQVIFVLEDLDGTQVHIPAADYQEYQWSLQMIQGTTEETISYLRRATQMMQDALKAPQVDMGGWMADREVFDFSSSIDLLNQASYTAGGPAKKAGLPPALQIPVGAGTTEARRVVAEMEAEFAAADFTDEIQAAVTMDADLKVKMGIDTAHLGGELGNALSMLSQITSGSTSLKIKVGIDQGHLGNELGSALQMLSAITSGSTSLKIKVGIDTGYLGNELGSALQMLSAITSSSTSLKIKVGIDQGHLGNELGAAFQTLSAITSASNSLKVKVAVEPQMDNFFSTITAFASGAAGGGTTPGFSAIKVPVTAEVTNVNTDLISTLYGAEGFQINVTAKVTSFQRAAGDLTVDVKATVTSFDFPGDPGGTAAVVPVKAQVTGFDFPGEPGAAAAIVPVKAQVTGFDFPGEPGAAAAVVPVKASIQGPIEIPETLVPEVVVTISQTGGAEVGALISALIALSQVLAVTWTATIAESGASGVKSSIEGVTSAARTMAKTWTATITQTGAAVVKGTITSLIDKLRQMAKTWTATVSLNNNIGGALDGIISDLRTIDGYTATATVTTNRVTAFSTRGVPGVATGGRVGSAGMKGKRSLDYVPETGDMRGLYASQLTPRATGGITRPGEMTLVGELGPELVTLPTGSYVHTARQTNNMMQEAKQTVVTFDSQSASNAGHAFGESIASAIARVIRSEVAPRIVSAIDKVLTATQAAPATQSAGNQYKGIYNWAASHFGREKGPMGGAIIQGWEMLNDGFWRSVKSGAIQKGILAEDNSYVNPSFYQNAAQWREKNAKVAGRANGGLVNELFTMINERGGELVSLPNGSFVHTAAETKNMVNPFSGQGAGTMVVNNTNTREGDTYNFGDVVIEAPDAATGRAAVDRLFEQVDRRAGHRQQLAQRGMVSTDDPRFW